MCRILPGSRSILLWPSGLLGMFLLVLWVVFRVLGCVIEMLIMNGHSPRNGASDGLRLLWSYFRSPHHSVTQSDKTLKGYHQSNFTTMPRANTHVQPPPTRYRKAGVLDSIVSPQVLALVSHISDASQRRSEVAPPTCFLHSSP